jgi:hypothetical protein
MVKRSDRTGSVIELWLVEVQFKLASTNAWSCSHSSCSGVVLRGVNKTWRPGDTRDVNGGVEV